MKKFYYLMFLYTACFLSCIRLEESQFPGEKIKLRIHADHPGAASGTKVAIDSDTLAWTGEETAMLIFGIDGKDNKNNPVIPSVAPGVFEGEISVPSGFSLDNLRGIVVPGDNGAYFRGSHSTDKARIRMKSPTNQVQQVNGKHNQSNVPFFAELSSSELILSDGVYTMPGKQLWSGNDLILFNIYGSHPDQLKDEVFKSIRIDASGVITEWSEYNLGSGKTSYNSNAAKYAVISLEEKHTIADKSRDNGLKVYMGIVLGGGRTISKVTVTTDKAIYTKDLSYALAQDRVSKLNIYQVGIDLSNGYSRESVVETTPLAIDPDSPRAAMGASFDNMTGYTLMVDGEERVPYKDSEGNWCIGLVENKDAEAKIVWENYQMPFGCSPDESAMLPFSQFYGITTGEVSKYPLFGKLDADGKLVFTDAFALLDITVRGYADIHSVKVRTIDGASLSTEGVDFAVLNCVRQNDGPVPLQKSFQIPVMPGTYNGGLEVTVCDSRKLMHRLVADVTEISAGEVRKVDVAYSPEVDLVYYEGFDNCVWGTDMSGRNKGFGPDDTAYQTIWRTSLTGYENAFVEAAAGTAGSGFQQPDTWKNSYTVTSAHTMSDSYVDSRDFWSWKYLFRSQEFQGCIGVGANYKYRGWVESPALKNLTEASVVKVSFRILLTEGATENFEFAPLNAGSITGLSIDSVPVLNSSGSEIWSGSSSYVITADRLASGWHDVTFTINGATSATTFRMRGNLTSGELLHGFYLDDITVVRVGVAQIEADGLSELKTLSTVKASFNLVFDTEDTEGLTMSLPSGGFICGLEIDSQPVADNKYGKTQWPLCKSHKIALEDVGAGEHAVTFIIESADANTTFTFSGATESVSNLKVEKVSSIEKGNFRLLLWNVQMGVWADQGNNYDNFVTWVNKYDPDCFAIIEAETVKKTGSTTGVSSAEKYFTNGWKETAARFGHSYVANGGNRDSYSQELTSKTPITTLQKITDTDVSGKPVQHGAGHFRITAGGKEIDIVTMHTWPQSYAPGASDQAASTAAAEGDYYRLHEVEYVMKQTVLNPEYASQTNWIVVGDMNSLSRADNWYYGYEENSTKLIAQDYIRDNTDLLDVIEMKYPGRFINTTASGTARIDFMYVSPSLYEFLDSAIVIRDDWTSEVFSGLSNYWYPSDHRPILVDFNF